jgi:hypothetical protein
MKILASSENFEIEESQLISGLEGDGSSMKFCCREAVQKKMTGLCSWATTKTKAQTVSLIAINSIRLRRYSDIFNLGPERLKSLACFRPT